MWGHPWPRPEWPTAETLAHWANEHQVLMLQRHATRTHPQGHQRKTDWPYCFRVCEDCAKNLPLTAYRLGAHLSRGHTYRCRKCLGIREARYGLV